MKINLNTHGFHCDRCGSSIEKYFGGLPGIDKASISESGKSIWLEGDEEALKQWNDDSLNGLVNIISAKCFIEPETAPEVSQSRRTFWTQMILLLTSALLFIFSLNLESRLTIGLSPLRIQMVNVFLFAFPYLLCGYTVLILTRQLNVSIL